MTDTTITNGETEKLINREQARRIILDDDPTIGFLVYTDADIRIVQHRDKEQARAGHPIPQGTTYTIATSEAMHAYADGADATVSVTRMVDGHDRLWVVGDGVFG